MNKEKIKRIINIVANVLLYLFIAICILGVVLTITAKKDSDGTATVLGWQMRIVLSSSMEKCDATDVSQFEIKDIPVRSMVFIEVVPEDKDEAAEWYSNLEIGDVLTFKYVYTRQETITHRITDIKDNGKGGYIITLNGDNKDGDLANMSQVIDTSLSDGPEYIIGKVTGQSYILGLFVSVLRSTLGIILIVILPSLIIIGFEVVKIVKVLGEDKKKQAQLEKEQKDSEIDMLRRELEALKANVIQAAPPSQGPPAEAVQAPAQPEDTKTEEPQSDDMTPSGK